MKTREQIEKIVTNNSDNLSLRYMKRACYFKNYSGSCGFNPLTGEGHSYNWYALSTVIKGQLVINSYSYSNQTCKHRNKLMQLCRLLGYSYISIPAPRGLQSLDSAKIHMLRNYGDAEVTNKYSRKQSPWGLSHALNDIRTARSLGMKFSKQAMTDAVAAAEIRRRERLDSLKARKIRRAQYLAELEQRRFVAQKQHLSLVSGGAA